MLTGAGILAAVALIIGVLCAVGLLEGLFERIAVAVETIAREAVEQRRITEAAQESLHRAKVDYEEARRRLEASYGEAITTYRAAAAELRTKADLLTAEIPGTPS